MRYLRSLPENDDALSVLRCYWGYDSFRSLQKEIIDSVLSGCDTLGLMPTGGGKSITFQVPALMKKGLTLVITPLISLMKDQTDNLNKKGIRAVFLQAGMTSAEIRKSQEILMNTDCRFLYVSPERLQNENFCNDLRRMGVNLIVVDEAHCISQWGYDFRPSYLRIANLRKHLPNVPMLALTATATTEVVRDIMDKLGFRGNCNVLVKSFRRDNLSYVVRHTRDKYAEILHILNNTEGSAIVYARSRKKVAEMADFLCESGVSATFYHAGMRREFKDEAQALWMKGEYRVIVATNAFGMGIDKPDVRVVIHFDVPPSLEEYYQEAGRAGRDGLPSYAVLLTGQKDPMMLKRRLAETFPDKAVVRKVYERVCNFLHISLEEGMGRLYEFSIDKFCLTFGMQEHQVESSLKILTTTGYMNYIEETLTRPRVMVVCERSRLFDNEMSKNCDVVLQALLRNYPGLFADYVTISEDKLAIAAGIVPGEVVEALIALEKLRLISFVPRKRTPYIYMPNPRVESVNVMIGRNAYEDRREAMRVRLNAMGEYAFSTGKCRENMMLSYFGESRSDGCGRCDVCRDSRRKGKRKATLISEEELAGRISEYIGKSGSGVEFGELREHFGRYGELLPSVLSLMCEEGMLELDDRGYYRLS